MSLQQTRTVMEAFDRARTNGVPFNRHWTVHYERAGIEERDGARFVGDLLSGPRRYIRRRDGRFAAAWVRENGEGKGAHVHIAMHVPDSIRLVGLTRRFIKAAGGQNKRGVSKITPIGGSLASSRLGGPHYEENAEKLLCYFLKCVDAELGEELGLARYGEGGLVTGKRAGRTQNLG